MKIILLFTITLLSFTAFSQEIYLSHNYSESFTVFADKVNLRAKPSINSKIVGVVNSLSILSSNHDSYPDTIYGKAGRWYKVSYKNKEAYVWNGLITETDFRSQVNPNERFIINQSKVNHFDVKIFKKGKFYKKFSLPTKDKFYVGYSIGSTYNSNGNDVFVFSFGDFNHYDIKLYIWDGQNIKRFNKALRDSSFVDYKRFQNSIILGNSVNLRSVASIDSKVIKVLNFGDKVRHIGTDNQIIRDTINAEVGYWLKVVSEKDTAFVWAKYLSVYSFNSYKQNGLRFVISYIRWDLKSKIFAIKGNKVIDSYPFNTLSTFIGAHPMGNMGMENISEFIGICFGAESCGQTGGDIIIAWDGKKFHKFANEEGVGDGSLSDGFSIDFPSEINGEIGIIKIGTYESEAIDTYSEKGENNYEYINRKFLIRKYEYYNDSLTEVNSKTIQISNIIKDNFSKYELKHFIEGDINNDGYADAVAYARKSELIDVPNGSYQESVENSLITVLLNDKKGGYILKTYSKKLIYHDGNDPLIKLLVTKGGFIVNVYYSGYYNEKINLHYSLNYNYDKDFDNFIMTKVVEDKTPNEYSGGWERRIIKYNTKKILFKDSYHPPIEYAH
jgi:uncharacterized protein YgiM (DUF1202 family)